ncbi:MAG: hypothetical protein WD066_14115, partial [Planctomycetaceae bacterium]
MTQPEQDRDRLTKYAANPTARSVAVVANVSALVIVISAMAVSFKGNWTGAIAVSPELPVAMLL